MTLYDKLTKTFQNNGESWANVIAHTLSEEELAHETIEYDYLPFFELWTSDYVYSVTTDSDDGDYITAVHRNPPKH